MTLPYEDTCLDRLVDDVLRRYPTQPSSLIAVLQDLQEEARYLPRTALERVARELHVPRAQLYHVATFYKAFSLTPRGKHLISICRGTACHVKGTEKVADALLTVLHIADGETSADGLFSLQSVRCLGCCSLAPALMIDGEIFGQVTAKRLPAILQRYQSEAS